MSLLHIYVDIYRAVNERACLYFNIADVFDRFKQSLLSRTY